MSTRSRNGRYSSQKNSINMSNAGHFVRQMSNDCTNEWPPNFLFCIFYILPIIGPKSVDLMRTFPPFISCKSFDVILPLYSSAFQQPNDLGKEGYKKQIEVNFTLSNKQKPRTQKRYQKTFPHIFLLFSKRRVFCLLIVNSYLENQ